MTKMVFVLFYRFTNWVNALRGGLHGSGGAWRRCNSLEWNNHSASLRLATHLRHVTGEASRLREKAPCGHSRTHRLRRTVLWPHPHNRTLHPVQLRFLG
jgi:hypothetical protein